MKQGLYRIIIFILFISNAQAQFADSLKSNNKILAFNNQDILAPCILFGTSLILFTDNELFDNGEFKDIRNRSFPNFHTHLDDYLQFAPIALTFVSDLFGAKAKSRLWDQGLILLKAEILTGLFVLPLKYITHVQRPDGSDYHSFPSGHTAEAFMAATFLHKEFGEQSAYYSIAAYSLATTVGLLRIANNKHWASDVLAGAAFGILSTNLAYKIFKLKSSNKLSNQIQFEPSYSRTNYKLAIHYYF